MQERDIRKDISLEDLRKELDQTDRQLIELLARRFRITHEVGIFKAKNGLPPKDESREAAQFKRFSEIAAENGLDPEIANSVLRVIIDKVVEEHKKLQDSNPIK